MPLWNTTSTYPCKKLLTSPTLLWKAACEYFAWCDANPWQTIKTKTTDKGEQTDTTPIQRPYSIGGMRLYIRCTPIQWQELADTACPNMQATLARIHEVIDTQHFEGAVTGTFNSAIINKLLSFREPTPDNCSATLTAHFQLTPISTEHQTFADTENDR